ncbi:MAG: serine hydrolase [bacterium]|nr:serine hydrolase [bacterium]
MVSVFASVSFSTAQSTEEALGQAVDDFIEAQIVQQQIPGLALAVVQEGEVLIAQGYGLANLEEETPVAVDTLFESASTVKPFIATAIMRLMEDGRLELDEPIRTYLEEAPPTWEGITVRYLLSHTSGLPYSLPGGTTEGNLQDWLAEAITLPLDFQPGERFQYSDLGYFVLRVILERVSGQSYADFMRSAVFEPAGMTRTTPINDLEDSADAQLATGYQWVDGVAQPQQVIDQAFDLDLYYSLADLIAWENAYFGGEVLDPETLAQQWTPVRLNDGTAGRHGLGWAVQTGNFTRIEHGGVSGGFSNTILHIPEADLTVIVLTNLRLARAWDIAYGVVGLIEPALLEATATQAEVVNDPEPETTAVVGAFVQALINGTLEREQFTPELQAVFEDILLVGQDLRVLGAPTDVIFLERVDADGLRTYRYRIVFGSIGGSLLIAFDDQERIANLEIGTD